MQIESIMRISWLNNAREKRQEFRILQLLGVKCLRYVNDHVAGDAVEPIPYVPPPVL